MKNYKKTLYILNKLREELKRIDEYNMETKRHLGGIEAYISKKLFYHFSKK